MSDDWCDYCDHQHGCEKPCPQPLFALGDIEVRRAHAALGAAIEADPDGKVIVRRAHLVFLEDRIEALHIALNHALRVAAGDRHRIDALEKYLPLMLDATKRR